MADSSMDERILQALERLTGEVQELRKTSEEQARQLAALQQSRFGMTEVERDLLEQISRSSPNLQRWVHSLDRMRELMDDLMPLGKPMLEEIVSSLDEATHTFDFADFKELLRQLVLNLSNLAEIIKMAGGIIDLKNESAQILKDAFGDSVIRLEDLKRKGFFDSMREIVRIMELVGQRTLELDAAQVKPINGVFGLYAALKKPEVRDGLGVLVEMLSVLAVVKNAPVEPDRQLPS